MRRILGAVALALALAAARASGQGMPLATLAGTVTAEDGKAIPGVTVSVASPSLQGTRQALTSGKGEYLIALLPPGDYRVTFHAAGLEEALRTVALPAAATVRLDQALRPAPVSASVTVSGDTAPEKGPEIAANFPQTLINALPSERTLRDAALLAPGVNDNGPIS
ncbi:MAG TPA: carboxypeptidase-like regulatory domain-containing protein, partial [Thermoanaerobaculia bacterium]|nr:carboxypeptidase-like regulatory domain-containing protein [Thermoanaerobaculia bacterium]